MSDITIFMEPDENDKVHTFKYKIEEKDKDGEIVSVLEAKPVVPQGERAGGAKFSGDFVQGVEFSITLNDRLVLECAHPFTAFFRYGTPEKGDINSTDEEKQIRSRPLNDDGTKHRASVRAHKWGLFAPVIIIHKPEVTGQKRTNRFLYDRGLSFEVNPAGA